MAAQIGRRHESSACMPAAAPAWELEMSVTRKLPAPTDRNASTLNRRNMLRLLGLSATTAYAAPTLLGLTRAHASSGGGGGGGTPGQGTRGSGSGGPGRKKKKKKRN
jgi:uncharacterized membrane protein YgcG